MKGFLYGQTEYNMFNNTIHLDDYINYAVQNKFDFLSITDKNLYAHYKFYLKCKKNNIKPIIGLECNFMDDDGSDSYYLLYPYNNDGFKNLIKISTLISTKQITKIEEVNYLFNGIYVIFSLFNSIIERYYYNDNIESLNIRLNEIKASNYYLGISKTNNIFKQDFTNYIESIAINNNMKVLPLHNVRYLESIDICAYESLTLIGGKEIKIQDGEDYSFLKNPISTNELDLFIDNINIDIYNESLALPKYPNTKGVSSKEYLRALAIKGLNKRIPNHSNIYKDRLEYELNIINKMGYDDYFLIVWDFIKYAKKNEILVGPGRGSAAGSLVAYSIGITEIDPLKYNLLFERFLNPERVSMPDIDIDFPDDKRDVVIDYVKNLYGANHICNISAYGTFQVKSSIRELGRVKKISEDRINELILIVSNYGFEKALDDYKNREEIYNFLFIASKLNDLPKHISTHAAGIILSDLNLEDIIPLQNGINGLFQSQLEAVDLEGIGLLKIDFLGLRNLAMIDEMVREIKNKFDLDFLRNINLNDKKTYDLLKQGDTLGVFQLESGGIRRVLTKLKPNYFEEIVAVLALYRPGPMDNIDEFVARKNHKHFDYIHPILEPILKETYGIIVYQEQIMQIARAFAGYSLGEADMLRRAVSKKKAEILKTLELDFIKRSIKMGHKEVEAKQIYDLIYKFANYGFNKSHSVAYALVSYWMAYLKANYFSIFMSKMLNYVIGNTTTLISYLKYSKAQGLVIYKPNINTSSNTFVSTNVGIFMPFTIIYSIGMIVSNQIVQEREKNGLFKSFEDFISRTKFLSESCIEALIYAGALDIFGKTKKEMIENKSAASSVYLKHLTGIIHKTEEYDENYLKNMEMKYLGMNVEYDIFKDYESILRKYHLNELILKANVIGNYLLSFENVKEIKTKNGDMMLVGNVTNNKVSLDCVIFPSSYKELHLKITTDVLYIVNGKIGYNRDNKLQLIVNNVNELH